MAVSPKRDFIDLIAEVNRAKGLDELTSNVIGILFIEPAEVSLEQLSKRTGYSLSAVSTSMKMLVASGLIKRKRRPKSKKLYFFMEKDMFMSWKQMIEKISVNIKKIKSRVPRIIEDYRRVKYEGSREERRIVEKYYHRLLEFERVIGKCMVMCQDVLSYNEGKGRGKK
jgi:DNA-binding transcriptional regulator GbsR (MarR family)